MNFLKKLFGKNKKDEKSHTETEHETKNPDFIDAANLIYEKKYDEAIQVLKQQLSGVSLEDTSTVAMIHINLTQAYFKNRENNPEHFDLSTHHAIEALKYGHNTGFAPHRAVVNLEKQKRIKHAIEICEVITDSEYSLMNPDQKDWYQNRLTKLQSKIKINDDNFSGKLLSEEEVDMIIQNSKIGIFPEENTLMSEEEFEKHIESIARGDNSDD